MNADSPRLRFAIVGVVTISLIAALFARLWFLQVMTSPQYQAVANSDHVLTVRTEAPRGRILDREGKVLVDNRPSIEVAVDWQAYTKLTPPQQSALLARLAPVINRYAAQQFAGQDDAPLPAVVGSTVAGGAGGTSTTTSTTSTTTTTSTTAPGATPLAPPKPVTVASLRAKINDKSYSHFKPVPVAKDVSTNLEIYLVEHAREFPTVSTRDVLVREYPYGQLAAQVLGWVAAVSPADLKQFQNTTKPYALTDEVGKSGIEREMEPQLRGVPGLTRYEVNARNQVVRTLSSTPPIPGDDVYLSIDIRLQYLAEESLAAQIAKGVPCSAQGCGQPKTGSVVVTDPRSGQVLAMASYPTYDPNLFVGGISTADYKALTGGGKALENKTISETYPAGSTWKLFTAYSGLTHGMITPDTTLYDPGQYHVNGCTVGRCIFYGANHASHGNVNLSQAITVSSDVYFYSLGDRMWDQKDTLGDDALAQTYKLWGFGAKTGSGLPDETAGRVPSPEVNVELAKAEYLPSDPSGFASHKGWTSGDNMNAAIGQGLVATTPLQLVNGYATFANGGTLYKPQLVLEVNPGFGRTAISVSKPQVVRQIPLPVQWRVPMLAGFEGVTQSSLGTAGPTFAGFPQSTFPVAGKTGTAQVQGAHGALERDTSLFVAFAPATAPQFAAVAIVPQGGNGGQLAAPLIRSILQPLAAVNGKMSALPAVPPGGAFDLQQVEQQQLYAASQDLNG